jgi:murein DD-endopeptidase MepM/ murein hydrolase activator NlpD
MPSPAESDADAVSPPLAHETSVEVLWRYGCRLGLWIRREVLGLEVDRFASLRLASHLVLLGVVMGLLALSRVQLPRWEVAPRELLPVPQATPEPLSFIELLAARGGVDARSQSALTRRAVPFTIIPERPRLDIETYVVQPGDTVYGIAQKFGLKPETILWSNPELESNPDLLRVGDRLVILPVNGVYHRVTAKDTIAAIAKQYKVAPEAIVGYAWNKLTDPNQTLTPGTYLIVPGGQKPFVPRQVAIYNGPIPQGAKRGSGVFGWPASGYITQKYWSGHRAFDIGAWIGSPVVAADSGFVVYAGWDRTGYGNLIVIDHGNGFSTYYAHLSKIFVRVGESVAKGQRIGSIGSTGRSTGPHLHFEIRLHGVQQNPGSYLR